MHLYGVARESRTTAEVAIAMLTSAVLAAIEWSCNFGGWPRDRVRILREGDGPSATIRRVSGGNMLMCRRFLPDRSVAAFFEDGMICTILS